MPLLKLGLAGAVIIAAALGLLWITEVLPGDEVSRIASWSFGGLIVLLLAAVALRAIRGDASPGAGSDQPVP